jgi:hypothetical protein
LDVAPGLVVHLSGGHRWLPVNAIAPFIRIAMVVAIPVG